MALSGSVTTSAYNGRSVTFYWSATQSVANNTSTISWTLKGSGSFTGWVVVSELRVTCDGVQRYYRDNTNHTDTYNGTQLASGSFTVSHSADGSKSFSIKVEAGIYQWAINCTGSGTATLNTIPRASSFTVPSSITMGTAATITISRASSSFTHTLTYSFYTQNGTIGTAKTSSTSLSWTPAISLASQIPSTTSGRCTLTLKTYSGSTQIGTTSKTVVLKVPTSVKPTAPTVMIRDSDTAIRDTFWAFIQNQSKLKIMSSSSGSYGSTIKSYSVNFDGRTYTGATVTTDVCQNSGDRTVTVTATDSRGRTASTSTTVSITAYEPPSIETFQAYRASDTAGTEDLTEGTYLAVNLKYSVTSLDSKNTVSAVIKYKKRTDTDYTDMWTDTTDYEYDSTVVEAGFSTDYQYDVQLVVSDYFSSTDTLTITLPTAAVIMDFKADGTGMAIGKVSEEAGLEIEQSWRKQIFDWLYPVGTLYSNRSDTRNPSEIFGFGTWVQVTDAFLWAGQDLSDIGRTGGSLTHTHHAGSLVANIGAYDGGINKIGYQAATPKGVAYTYGGHLADYETNIAASRVSNGTSVHGTTASASSMPPYVKVAVWYRTA